MNNIIRGGLIGTAIATVLNSLIYFIMSALGVTLDLVNGPYDEATLGPVIFLTLLASIGAVVVLWLLDKFTDRPIEFFLWIALVVGLLSFIPTYMKTETRTAFVGLGLLHVGAVIGLVWGLLHTLRGETDIR